MGPAQAFESRYQQPYPTGIRAQAVGADGSLIHDFLFADTNRMIHVLNAPSPAATAALPIGQMIAARALGEQNGADEIKAMQSLSK